MIFDRAAGIFERHAEPISLRRFREAALFNFTDDDYLSHIDEIRKAVSRQCLFLPYETVAIENGKNLVLMYDAGPVDDSLRKIEFLICADSPTVERLQEMVAARWDGPMSSLLKRKFSSQEEFVGNYALHHMAHEWSGHRQNTMRFVSGSIRLGGFEESDIRLCEGSIDHLFVASNAGVEPLKRVSPEDRIPLLRTFIPQVKVALLKIAYINSPRHFIFETSPVKTRAPKKNAKILRSHERPVYTILRPEAIRKLLDPESANRDATGTAAERTPHMRRAHLRTYRDPRYTEAVRGQTVIIPACWVGPEERQVGGRRYRVVLDR